MYFLVFYCDGSEDEYSWACTKEQAYEVANKRLADFHAITIFKAQADFTLEEVDELYGGA